MALISLVKASKDFGVKPLFKDLDLYISKNERLGLIGPNGSGKSTLLKIIAGREALLTGERKCSSSIRVALVDQEDRLDKEKTVLEEVLKGCGEKRDLLLRFNELTKDLELNPQKSSLLRQLGQLSELMDANNAWNVEQQCKEILRKCFDQRSKLSHSDSTSGNQKPEDFAVCPPCIETVDGIN